MPSSETPPLFILAPEDHAVLGETEFGMRGLLALESIGPFTTIQASGPLVTVHDATIDSRLGIGHHPHRLNERLFFIEQGELDHDDAANGISGHIGTGEVGQFTEGRLGMMHSEWNNGDIDTRAFILVYSTDPVPEAASFHVLRDEDAPRYDEGPGVRTKELVGPRSPLQVNGDIRLFAESVAEIDAEPGLNLGAGEGGLISIREGSVMVNGQAEPLASGVTLIAPPAEKPRAIQMRALQQSRILRVVHGAGHGFIEGPPRLRTRSMPNPPSNR